MSHDVIVFELGRMLDVLAELKMTEGDSFITGVLAGLEDAIEDAQQTLEAWVS